MAHSHSAALQTALPTTFVLLLFLPDHLRSLFFKVFKHVGSSDFSRWLLWPCNFLPYLPPLTLSLVSSALWCVWVVGDGMGFINDAFPQQEGGNSRVGLFFTANKQLCCLGLGPLGCFVLYYSRVQLPRTMFIEVGRSEHATKSGTFPCGLENWRLGFFKSTLSTVHSFVLCSCKGPRLSPVCPSAWDYGPSREGLIALILFSSPPHPSQLSLHARLGERGTAADNLQMWCVPWMMGGPTQDLMRLRWW